MSVPAFLLAANLHNSGKSCIFATLKDTFSAIRQLVAKEQENNKTKPRI